LQSKRLIEQSVTAVVVDELKTMSGKFLSIIFVGYIVYLSLISNVVLIALIIVLDEACPGRTEEQNNGEELEGSGLPSKRTIYLPRDLIPRGEQCPKITDLTDYMVLMWTNRFDRDFTVDRNNGGIPQVDNEFRIQIMAEIMAMRNCALSYIGTESKEMLRLECARIYRATSAKCISSWNVAIDVMNKDIAAGLRNNPWRTCYGDRFSKSWMKVAQDSFMEKMNIKFRQWDKDDGICPNGFFAAMYSSTKGHHVRDVNIRRNSLQGAAIPSGTVSAASIDPNFVDIRKISQALIVLGSSGTTEFSLADVQTFLTNFVPKKNPNETETATGNDEHNDEKKSDDEREWNPEDEESEDEEELEREILERASEALACRALAGSPASTDEDNETTTEDETEDEDIMEDKQDGKPYAKVVKEVVKRYYVPQVENKKNQVGRCCAREFCAMSMSVLKSIHRCVSCQQYIHSFMCGVDTQTKDPPEYWCKRCFHYHDLGKYNPTKPCNPPYTKTAEEDLTITEVEEILWKQDMEKEEHENDEMNNKSEEPKKNNKRKQCTPTKITLPPMDKTLITNNNKKQTNNKKTKTAAKLYRGKYYVCQGTCEKTYWTSTASYINKGQRLFGRVCISCDKPLTKKIVRDNGVRYCNTINGPVEDEERNEHCEHVVCGVCAAMTISGESRKPASRSNT
jgi:hypothetical protein